MGNNIEYINFYLKRRIRLHHSQSINHLSAGLQPKIAFIRADNDPDWKSHLITSSGKYLMFDSYIWDVVGRWKSPLTGSDIPIYGNMSPIKGLRISSMGPIQSLPNYKSVMNESFLSFLRFSPRGEFTIDEDLEEIIGEGLFEAGLPQVKVAKPQFFDINGNGAEDFLLGSNDWSEYHPRIFKDGKWIITRWSHKDYKPFDENGKWRGGRLHGNVYFFENKSGLSLKEIVEGNHDEVSFAKPVKLENIDQYGYCAPVFHDFTGDGLIDMIAGSFLRDIKFFKRIPDKDGIPRFSEGIPLLNRDGKPIELEGVINYLELIDINNNGRKDIIVSSESGYISVLENLGEVSDEGIPLFSDQMYLLQNDAPAKSDILSVPSVAPLRKPRDMKAPPTLDMISGNGAGYFDLFEDIHTLRPKMKWHLPGIKRILPPDPERGSIQGPSEMGWGYTAPTLFDWNNNGLYDLVFGDINGEHMISFNRGNASAPNFAEPVHLLLKRGDDENPVPFFTVWRVKPALIRLKDGRVRYYTLDEHGILAIYEKVGTEDSLVLKKLGHARGRDGETFKFTRGYGGSLGRDKFQLFDWDDSGVKDLIIAVPGGHDFRVINPEKNIEHYPVATVAVMKNLGTDEDPIFDIPRYLKHKELKKPVDFGHHSCAAEAYRYDGKVHLIVGAEDGNFYHFLREEFMEFD